MRSRPRHRHLLRRLVLLVVVVALLALGADSLLWWFAGRKVEAAFAGWVQRQRAQGFRISVGSERLTGWPRAAIVDIRGFSVAGGEALVPGGLEWRAAELRLGVDLIAPRRLEVAPVGSEYLRLFGGPELAVTARHLEAELPLGGPRRDVSVTGEDASVGPAGLAPKLVTAGAFSATVAPGAASGETERGGPREVVKVEASGVGLGGVSFKALGPRIGVVSVDAALIGPALGGPDWAESLKAWRDAGGAVAFRGFSLVWGPLAIGGSGRLELDHHLQPTGQGRARIVGYAATLDALAAAGTISAGEATAAKAVMMLLERPAREGSPPEVDVPLRLENRTLSVGRIPLFRMPEIRWPTAP